MQRYFSTKSTKNYLYLNEDDIYHIRKVMRMNNNDLVEIVYDNKLYICIIEDINQNIKFKIKEEIDNFINQIPEVTLIIPYLKEAKMDIILQKATEIGVSNFILCPMERSMVKIDSKKLESKINSETLRNFTFIWQA